MGSQVTSLPKCKMTPDSEKPSKGMRAVVQTLALIVFSLFSLFVMITYPFWLLGAATGSASSPPGQGMPVWGTWLFCLLPALVVTLLWFGYWFSFHKTGLIPTLVEQEKVGL